MASPIDFKREWREQTDSQIIPLVRDIAKLCLLDDAHFSSVAAPGMFRGGKDLLVHSYRKLDEMPAENSLFKDQEAAHTKFIETLKAAAKDVGGACILEETPGKMPFRTIHFTKEIDPDALARILQRKAEILIKDNPLMQQAAEQLGAYFRDMTSRDGTQKPLDDTFAFSSMFVKRAAQQEIFKHFVKTLGKSQSGQFL